jgi:hypothetical protein
VGPAAAGGAHPGPGPARHDLVTAAAETIAAWFGRVVVYEDADKRGRAPGEMTALITAAIRRARPGVICAAADGPEAALRAASGMAAGSPVLFLYEKLEMARQALAAIGARPCPADTAPVGTGPAGTRPSPAATSQVGAWPSPADPASTRPHPADTSPTRPRPFPTAANPASTRPLPADTSPTRPRPFPTATNPSARPLPADAEPAGPSPTANMPGASHPVSPLPSGPAPSMPSGSAPADGAADGTEPLPATRSDPLRRPDRDTQWNRGHY